MSLTDNHSLQIMCCWVHFIKIRDAVINSLGLRTVFLYCVLRSYSSAPFGASNINIFFLSEICGALSCLCLQCTNCYFKTQFHSSVKCDSEKIFNLLIPFFWINRCRESETGTRCPVKLHKLCINN